VPAPRRAGSVPAGASAGADPVNPRNSLESPDGDSAAISGLASCSLYRPMLGNTHERPMASTPRPAAPAYKPRLLNHFIEVLP
jgi:hypothetical protein